MKHMMKWKVLAILVGLTLAAALVALLLGNTSMAAALIVVALLEGAFHAVALAILARKRRSAGEH